jgi:hypothetical protein
MSPRAAWEGSLHVTRASPPLIAIERYPFSAFSNSDGWMGFASNSKV